MASLLWIDDQIERYIPYVNAFESHGLRVDSAGTLEDGLQLAGSNIYDFVFVDAMLGHVSCLNLLPSLLRLTEKAKLFVCSGFLYLDSILEQARALKGSVQNFVAVIDKTSLPFSNDDGAVEAFLEKLYLFNREDAIYLDRPADEIVKKVESTQSLPTWDEYIALTAQQRLDLADYVVEMTVDIREALRNRGVAYALFCGTLDRPLLELSAGEPVPDEQELIDIARAHDSAVIPFRFGGVIDDLSDRCSSVSGLASYPTLKIAKLTSSESVHYDTGNSLTLLSYEWYLEKGWISTFWFPEIYEAGNMTMKGRYYTIEAVSFVDAVGKVVNAPLDVFCVTNWSTHRIAAACGRDCEQENRRADKLCNYRTGLLGRNIQDAIPFGLMIYRHNVYFVEPIT